MTPIHITTYTGFTDFDRAKMAQVLAAANRVLSDPRFKERIQSISHFDSSTDSGFAVWARIDAADLGISATLYTLPWYKRFSKEDAKDLPDGVAIVRGYFETAEIPTLVATLFHEITHVLGYAHPRFTFTRGEVPYQVERVAETVCRAQMAEDAAAVLPQAQA
jgi:hypothetical protein